MYFFLYVHGYTFINLYIGASGEVLGYVQKEHAISRVHVNCADLARDYIYCISQPKSIG